jgi:hypothetical protein
VGSSQGVADLKMRIWNEVSCSFMKHSGNVQGTFGKIQKHPSVEEGSGQQSGGGRPKDAHLE